MQIYWCRFCSYPEEMPPKKIGRLAGKKKCPHCGETMDIIPAEIVLVCPDCRRDGDQAEFKPGTSSCPNCGRVRLQRTLKPIISD
jgi:ribosomal protein L32